MAQHIYNEIPIITYGTKKEISDNIDARTVGDWTQVAVYCGKESLKMGIYVRKGEDINNASGYVIVFRGTNPTDLTCWENDIEAWNRSMDYYSIDLWEAIQNSKKFVESHPQDVIFVGHSKGGGEAIAAASATGKDAITFNAANFDFYDYGVVPKNTAGINNYYIKGEWLSGIIKPARYGTTHWIDTRNSSYIPGTNILIYKEPEFSNSFEKHAIELMINQLQVRGY